LTPNCPEQFSFLMMKISLKNTAFIFLFTLILFNQSCSTYRSYSKPSIKETEEWGMTKRCLYQGCGHKFETIKGKDIEIIIVANNGLRVDNIFTIKLLFYTEKNDYYFDPSVVKIYFNNKEVSAKGLRCSDTIHDLGYLRSAPHITGKTLVRNNDCIVLFFDTFPPNVDQEFQLKINRISTLNKKIQIPTINFSPEIHKGNWGKKIE
jgi:hypothetical protein